MLNQLFIEVTRNGTIESQHFGAAVVCDFKGNVLERWGDTETVMFPRSALKPKLAINVVESGASDHYALDNGELSLDILSDLAGTDIQQYPMGIDGCGFPAPTMPLECLGRTIAGFANPVNLSSQRAKAVYRLHEAIINEPLYAAGHGTVVSELNEITKGAILAKTGAEGVLIAALSEQGLGIALKIADGNARARPTALLAILDHLGVLSDNEKNALQAHINPQITNSRGQIVGNIRSAQTWLRAS